MTKKTIVVGASPKAARFSFKAVKELRLYKHPVVALGFRDGMIENVIIQKGKPHIEEVHTISLYMGKERQKEYYGYLIGLKPERIIFNPGTHNPEFVALAQQNKIEVVEDCMLVMLQTGNF